MKKPSFISLHNLLFDWKLMLMKPLCSCISHATSMCSWCNVKMDVMLSSCMSTCCYATAMLCQLIFIKWKCEVVPLLCSMLFCSTTQVILYISTFFIYFNVILYWSHHFKSHIPSYFCHLNLKQKFSFTLTQI